ncbi:MAG: membrane-like protein [Sphingobium sp.]|jgi:uncharacterized membrane protein|uniref:membrane-like protein n=1 Tax=Sphingobium sp. TaxID=1912891 RepID=UPI000C3F6B89|nr:membrane-like protein [Sphingobium sp.]MBU0659745.1 membrane-like protein [Alphaproteobacteria bacterium]MBA4755259.1 membrane-like protein [Sphingobium sp.]MBS90061.1 membrane-like protein [Sphingobium sp.]MBU0776520.1 membrane-like protein [Alphaproteobacteria bacterium]MBU0869463.1 membrane-like protein [Alphaproteobacteria bacterium]
MIGLRLAGLVAMGAGLAGCDSKLNNDAASVMQTVPVVVNSAPPENVAAPVSPPKNMKNNRFPVSRETLAPPEAPPVKAQPRPDYRAIGTEPFWAVTVRGTVATLERPDQGAMQFAVARASEKRTMRYVGDGFAMTISQGPCSDGMNDALWSDRVAVAFADGVLKGCGGERDTGDSPPG